MGHIRRWILRDRKRRYSVFRRSIYLDVATKRETFSLGACSQIGSELEKGQLFQGNRELCILPIGSSLEY
jgi:hypothetical protein